MDWFLGVVVGEEEKMGNKICVSGAVLGSSQRQEWGKMEEYYMLNICMNCENGKNKNNFAERNILLLLGKFQSFGE